ncbi:MAG: hypothetical protein BWX80_03801 [Candidatus Hydrogenedentes bacterium ADurb.Bin101]|nr:MAG: hypothetical protein BWX80_03801 [Candidatus Hydrogenedentes bacterium ADurb.Bin101]
MLLDHDRHRIQHMLEAAGQAMSFIENRPRSHLNTDVQLRLALLRALEVIGEAANKVTLETREAHPEIPWSKVVGIRNRLIHAYFEVDLDIVWKTTAESLPELVPMLQAIVGSDTSE